MSNSALVSQTTARRNSEGIRFGVVRVVAVALTMLAALDADAVVRFPARIPRVPRAPTRVPHAPVIPAGLIDWERRNGPRWPNQTPNKENKDDHPVSSTIERHSDPLCIKKIPNTNKRNRYKDDIYRIRYLLNDKSAIFHVTCLSAANFVYTPPQIIHQSAVR